MRSDNFKVECGCGMMYDKQGRMAEQSSIGCGRTGERMLGWMNNQVQLAQQSSEGRVVGWGRMDEQTSV